MAATPSRMSDQARVLTLKCPSCGADLEITADMDTFYCGYCGTRQMVQRRGGTVSLKLVGEAIARVQVGTDRTAAELALRRLSDELASIQSQQQQVLVHYRATAPEGLTSLGTINGFLLPILFTWAICYITDINGIVLIALLIGVAVLTTIIISNSSASAAAARKAHCNDLAEALRLLNSRAEEVQSEINDHNAFLNSRNA